jgi:hypothetical protein
MKETNTSTVKARLFDGRRERAAEIPVKKTTSTKRMTVESRGIELGRAALKKPAVRKRANTTAGTRCKGRFRLALCAVKI